MDYLKEFFEIEGAEKSFDAFSKWVKDKGLKLADLSKGEYESKAKTERLLADREAALKGSYKAKILAAKKEAAIVKAQTAKKKAEAKSAMSESEKSIKEMRDRIERANKEYEKTRKEIEALKAENEKARQAGMLAERKALYIQAGGKQENLDRDLTYLNTLINKETGFEDALNSYKEKNPDIFSAKNVGTVSTIPPLAGGNITTDAQALVDQERKRIGLPPKYGGK